MKVSGPSAMLLYHCKLVCFLSFAVAALSKLETLGSEMSRVATMELVDFWDFLEMLNVQVFQKFQKKVSLKVHLCICPSVCTSRVNLWSE